MRSFIGQKIWAISYESLVALCPKEMEAIEYVESFGDWKELVIGLDKKDSAYDCFIPLVEDLKKSFNKVTMKKGKGLELSLLRDHNSEISFDDVENLDGCVFQICGVYKLTLDGKKTTKLSAAASNIRNMISSFQINYPW